MNHSVNHEEEKAPSVPHSVNQSVVEKEASVIDDNPQVEEAKEDEPETVEVPSSAK